LISIVKLGTIDYETGLKLQQQLVALRKEEKIGDVLLLLEHKPVITLGRNAKTINVVATPGFLQQRGVERFECDRGGDVTFHGPGQIVGYPIFDLRGYARGADVASAPASSRKALGVIEFVRRLEDAVMRTCADFGIPTKRIAGLTGVWTNPETRNPRVAADAFLRPVEQSSTATAESTSQRGESRNHEGRGPEKETAFAADVPNPEAKLAAIGVHISRFVTSHGFALNVNTDLSYFSLIIPCGITTKPVTSMQKELSRAVDLNAVAESISRNIGLVFQSQILWLDALDALLCGAGAPARVP